MKRLALILVVLVLAAGAAAAEVSRKAEPEFRPRLPEIMAQGTSFTANAHGYGALFTNPAGFAMAGEGDFTLLSVIGAARINPFQLSEDMDKLDSEYDTEEALLAEAMSRQLSTNGIGSQSAVGLGYVGKGIGLGLISTVEADAQGKTQLGTEATAYWTLAAPMGYAVDLEPVEGYKVALGGDIRPMYRLAVGTTAADLLDMVSGEGDVDDLHENPVRTGSAMAFDLGAIFHTGPWRAGFSVRDLFGTEFYYMETQLGALLEEKGYEDVKAERLKGYGIPCVIRLGGAFCPELGIPVLTDLSVHTEYEIPIMPRNNEGDHLAPPGTFFTNLNMGGEVELFDIVSFQGGLTSGYLTGGLGLDFFFIEMSLAGYTEELGPHAGDNPASGFSMELAIRF